MDSAVANVIPLSPMANQASGDDHLGYLVRDVHRAYSRILHAEIGRHGVTLGQWFFLRALWERDGMTQRELSHRVGMMEPTTVTALNSMERAGFVQRVRNPHDRRKVNIYLTPKGRSLQDVLLPCAAAVSARAERGLRPADIEVAFDVLGRVLENIGGGDIMDHLDEI